MGQNGMETRRTGWVEVGDRPEWSESNVAAYRIWMQTDGRKFWQRHEWRMRDGSVDLGDWIDAHTNSFPAHHKPVTEDAA